MPQRRSAATQANLEKQISLAPDAESTDRIGLARFLNVAVPTTYRMQKEPGFPQPFYLNGNQPRWLVQELSAYVKAKAAARPSVRRAAALAARNDAGEHKAPA